MNHTLGITLAVVPKKDVHMPYIEA